MPPPPLRGDDQDVGGRKYLSKGLDLPRFSNAAASGAHSHCSPDADQLTGAIKQVYPLPLKLALSRVASIRANVNGASDKTLKKRCYANTVGLQRSRRRVPMDQTHTACIAPHQNSVPVNRSNLVVEAHRIARLWQTLVRGRQ